MNMIIRALGVYSNFKLLGKAEPEEIQLQKKKCIELLNKLTYLSNNPDRDYFDSQVETFVKISFNEDDITEAHDWGMHNQTWRMFYVLFDLVDSKQLQYVIDFETKQTIFDKFCEIMINVLKNSKSNNYSVKLLVINYMFPSLVNKSLEFVSPAVSNGLFSLLH